MSLSYASAGDFGKSLKGFFKSNNTTKSPNISGLAATNTNTITATTQSSGPRPARASGLNALNSKSKEAFDT